MKKPKDKATQYFFFLSNFSFQGHFPIQIAFFGNKL